MNASAYVDDARLKARDIVVRESRGPGDYDRAMRRCTDKYGVPYSAFWALWYRPPKAIAAHIYAAICEAAERQRQATEKAFAHERTIDEARAWFSNTISRGADALDRAAAALDRNADAVSGRQGRLIDGTAPARRLDTSSPEDRPDA